MAALPLGAEHGPVVSAHGRVTTRHFPTDALSSTRTLTDDAVAIKTRYQYEAFGETKTKGDFSANASSHTGRENDGPGLYYYRARYYRPSIKRFVSEDPLGLGGGPNLYAYVLGNPITASDPRGLDNPGMGPYGPYANPPSTGLTPGQQAAAAVGAFVRNYSEMRNANTIGADKYFHCMANCEATQYGSTGESVANVISDLREFADSNFTGDSPQACRADQAANSVGRSGGGGGGSCGAVCSGFRPRGLECKNPASNRCLLGSRFS